MVSKLIYDEETRVFFNIGWNMRDQGQVRELCHLPIYP